MVIINKNLTGVYKAFIDKLKSYITGISALSFGWWIVGITA